MMPTRYSISLSGAAPASAVPDETTVATEAALRRAMREHWGHADFRPNQRDAMLALAAGRDAVVVLPTGGGKSLCYQAPAVALGPCVVVSPLISLMHDQVEALRANGVPAAFLNSTLDSAEASRVMAAWRNGEIRVLYVAPERAITGGFRGLLRAAPPLFFAIDEAHCISHWGHDFRPDYRQLAFIRSEFADLPVHAFTATATVQVRTDIAAQLNLRDPLLLTGNFHRSNLHYRVERRGKGVADQVAEIMSAHAGRSGIVYCISRARTEQLSAALRERGFRALAYHAGMEAPDRRRVQDAFTAEEVDAVVATVAFGMGIDRSNVRFVIHAEMPKSVEHYQQETGRAGRDGLPAECVLLYSPADFMKWRDMLSKSEDMTDEVRAVHIAKLREMDKFASIRQCRHRFLVGYFGQAWAGGSCGNCDACGGGGNVSDCHPEAARTAQMILSCVLRLQERRGAQYVMWTLRGETARLQPADCGLSTFGLLSEAAENDVRRWIDECAAQGFLERSDGQYPVLRVTATGWEVLRKTREPWLSPPATAGGRTDRRRQRERAQAEHKEKGAVAVPPEAVDLFEELRALRKKLAAKQRLKPYMVFPDTVLQHLCVVRPTVPENLLAIPGIGDAKARRFGDAVTATITEYCTRNGLASDLIE